ncbi:3-methyladenine DNA glycosylase [Aquipuribacter nitratireducens]|uniref:3-methyladenine DNA glycosylase n=1 Tax=Aquipuribacter nitratireducens TaxID=650104 RepID=A0ABW0GLA2_9MICO
MTTEVLPPEVWRARLAAHEARADALSAGHRSRRARGEPHAVEDFLWTYYPTRPAQLRRRHPGAGVALAPAEDGAALHAAWRWYREANGVVDLDVDAYVAARGDTVRFVHRLLTATATRPAFTGCLGLHEWAMVYRQGRDEQLRHPLPLRLGQAGTDAVVESHPVRCSHVDAFRFFTPAAVGRNRVQPTRERQVALEQPGCLHAAMDCHKWATKLGPAVPGELALDCFALAGEIRVLDMQASPYDLSSYALPPVAIETQEGRAEYVARQRELTGRAAALRERLVAVCETVLAGAATRG